MEYMPMTASGQALHAAVLTIFYFELSQKLDFITFAL